MSNTITLTDEQCEALGVPKGSTVGGSLVPDEAQFVALYPPKPKQWEPRRGAWVIYGCGEVCQHGSMESLRKDGSERETQEAAERASKLITRYKRLLAYVDEHRREGEVDDYIVCQNDHGWWVTSAEWITSADSTPLGAVRMPYRVAEQLVKDFESGVFVYDETKRPSGGE